MILLELFSGIGGFALGLQDAGMKFKKVYYSEVNKYAIANYKYNFKEAEYVGSVTDVQKWEIERPNIITFGSPCQDFSIAGKRSGLEGNRSSLIQYAIDSITRFRPDVFIWENVKGAFSSNSGQDFWAIIKAFNDIGGYRLEWQLLNTAWFLPQNRERIYLIGHLGNRSRSKVFPIGEGSVRTNEGTKQTPIVRTLQGGGHSGGHHSGMTILKQVGTIGKDSEATRVYSVDGNARTIKDGGGMGAKTGLYEIGAMRGRYPENPKSRVAGLPTEQMLEINENGTSNTISTVQKDNLVIQQRGRGFNKGGDHDICSHISSHSFEQNNTISGIRRLTPTECEKLQGFHDGWTKYGNFDGEVKEISDSQRYKMCGNAVTKHVVKEIGARLFQ